MDTQTSQEENKDSQSLWDQAINDATKKLERANRRVKNLKAALETFRRNRTTRTPWPGSRPAATRN